ncbi:MAG: dephospho-CoA kinase [Defluviitaleaceae bacterium]|nr:dephospho-CoA kinase [Defluviitaleaceae bacterium]
MTTIIGITGKTGSGKTTVCTMLAEMGAYIINADKITHKIIENAARAKIISTFGEEILDSKKILIDRQKLATIVFSNKDKLTQLEKILHPLVENEIVAEIKQSKQSGNYFIVVDAVLLVEANLHRHCNEVWLVKSERQKRLNRIIARDQITEALAIARMQNQRRTNLAEETATKIILNNGSLDDLQNELTEWARSFR